MPNIMLSDSVKKKFDETIRKFLSSGLFYKLTQTDTIELMIDILNHEIDIPYEYPINLFDVGLIEEILKKRKDEK